VANPLKVKGELKMLVLFDHQNQAHSFSDYRCLYRYLDRLERDRQSKNGLEAAPEWIFCRHSARRVNNWHAYVAERPRTSEAERELDVIEIIQDVLQPTRFVTVTPQVSVDNLQKDWCRAYCKSRRYPLIETLNPRKM
jgi:hypothetical protein